VHIHLLQIRADPGNHAIQPAMFAAT
jgi:hypothetical protein